MYTVGTLNPWLEVSETFLSTAWTLKTLRGERGCKGGKSPFQAKASGSACTGELPATPWSTPTPPEWPWFTFHRLPITGNWGHTTWRLLRLVQQAPSLAVTSLAGHCSAVALNHKHHTSRSPVPAQLAISRMWSSRKNKAEGPLSSHSLPLDLSTGARTWHVGRSLPNSHF